ncbi:MAG: DUF507 family protein [Deltaproteobacteria bacterium]|nr:DUF507 family protein [Deltaproteobacteria bacterium]
MKIKPDQLERLAQVVLARYKSKELLVSKCSEEQLKGQIIATVAQNFNEEEAIEEEARKLLAGHPQAGREIDSYKMFLLAKQKLAQKKGFVL